MQLTERIDEYGKPAWIALMVLSFIVFWPLGLLMLFYMMWSGRMGFWKNAAATDGGTGFAWPGCTSRRGRWHAPHRSGRSSGNRAFDAYREDTLKRLEEEHAEFQGYLERLRHARDKAEFDQFMDERAQKPVDDEPDAPEDNRPTQNGRHTTSAGASPRRFCIAII